MQDIQLTLIIAVYNEIKHLPELIESIKKNIENIKFYTLIVDDGSTDGSYEYLEGLEIPHLKLYRNETNIGFAYSLNRALEQVKTTYIVRIDADDVMSADRLRKQITFMEKNKNVAMAGSWATAWGDTTKLIKKNTENDVLQCELLFCSPFLHPTMIFRTEAMKDLRYDKSYAPCEDYELWTRIQTRGNIANIPEYLIKRRFHEKQMTIVREVEMKEQTKIIYQNQLAKLHILPTSAELELHYQITRNIETPDLACLRAIDVWLTKIYDTNQKYLAYPAPALTNYLKELWLKHMAGKAHLSKGHSLLFKNSPLSPYQNYTFWQKFKFWILFGVAFEY